MIVVERRALPTTWCGGLGRGNWWAISGAVSAVKPGGASNPIRPPASVYLVPFSWRTRGFVSAAERPDGVVADGVVVDAVTAIVAIDARRARSTVGNSLTVELKLNRRILPSCTDSSTMLWISRPSGDIVNSTYAQSRLPIRRTSLATYLSFGICAKPC
jgi:hypothetical protein